LKSLGLQQICEPFGFKPAHERAPDHSAMAGNENFIRLLHLYCSL